MPDLGIISAGRNPVAVNERHPGENGSTPIRFARVSNTATPKLKEFASRLLAYGALSGGTAAAAGPAAAFLVCERLRAPLGKLLGVEGFHTLLSRALALAGAEVPWLRALSIQADGSLAGFDEVEVKLDPGALTEGGVLLATHLLALLVTFIGPALTLQVLHDVWPKMKEVSWKVRMS